MMLGNPQVNGVVRTLKMTRRELERRHQDRNYCRRFRSYPAQLYPEISLALTTPGEMEKRIDRFSPDCLHIATEGPLGWMARRIAIQRKWPFTTAYHSRFPEYVHARFPRSGVMDLRAVAPVSQCRAIHAGANAGDCGRPQGARVSMAPACGRGASI